MTALALSSRSGWRAAPSVVEIERGAAIVLVAIGLVLRARGYLFQTVPFWLDESGWAKRLLTRPLSEFLIRPIGFMAATRGLVHLFSASEAWFRFLPWCGGIAVLAMTPFIAKRLLDSGAARMLLIACIALHPAAIDLSKEFKPYSVGLALHCALLLLALRYAKTGSWRDLWLTALVAVPGVFFAQDVLFAYPGLFLALALCAWRAQRTRQLAQIVATGAIALAVSYGLYHFMWRGAATHSATEFWGRKYDVFSESEAGASLTQRLSWFASKYLRMVALPGMRHEFWHARRIPVAALERLRRIDDAVWLGLHLFGLIRLARQRRLLAGLLLVLPILTLLSFNALRFWPFGAFRTNLFALAYFAPLAAVGVDELVELLTKRVPRWQLSAPLLATPAALLVLAPLLLFDRSFGGPKRAFAAGSEFRAAINRLLQLVPAAADEREPVVFDEYTCRDWAFYSKFHPRFSSEVAPRVKERFLLRNKCRPDGSFDALLREVRHGLRKSERVWLVTESSETLQAINDSWPADLEKTPHGDLALPDETLLSVERIRGPRHHRRHEAEPPSPT